MTPEALVVTGTRVTHAIVRGPSVTERLVEAYASAAD